jgi:hypothetical protein
VALLILTRIIPTMASIRSTQGLRERRTTICSWNGGGKCYCDTSNCGGLPHYDPQYCLHRHRQPFNTHQHFEQRSKSIHSHRHLQGNRISTGTFPRRAEALQERHQSKRYSRKMSLLHPRPQQEHKHHPTRKGIRVYGPTPKAAFNTHAYTPSLPNTSSIGNDSTGFTFMQLGTVKSIREDEWTANKRLGNSPIALHWDDMM